MIRVWALAWLVIMIIGAVLGGRRWIGAADPFEVYATTVARLSPWRRSGDGSLRLVNPLAGLNAADLPVGSAGVVAVLLGSTAFDSFANLSWWIQTVQSSDASPVLWETGGLLTMIGIVLITFAAASAWLARFPDRAGRRLPPSEAVRAMSGSLVPIVVGYAIAHYATLLIVEGQRVVVNLSDPLGLGWNVFGTADLAVSTAIFSHPTGSPCSSSAPSSAVTCSASSRLTRRPSACWTPAPPGRPVADAGGDGRLHVRRLGAAVLSVTIDLQNCPYISIIVRFGHTMAAHERA